MVSALINNLVSDLKPRQREIVSGRFGLTNGERQTLADLGKKYNITRERVRQIENESLRLISEKIRQTKLKDIWDRALFHLDSVGGLRHEVYFLNDLQFVLDDDKFSRWHLRFLFEVFGRPNYYNEDENYHGFWYLDEKTLKRAVKLIDKLIKFIADKKKDLLNHKKRDIILAKVIEPHPIPDFIALNYITISKQFGINNFGDFGLSDWDEITPKTMKAKAYLVLKKQGKPMHFVEIAEAINKAEFGGRKALPQTVHNELIKYPEFVLVGRGTYALAEFGYSPGTTREIIAKILKEKGPMTTDKLIDLVFKERLLQRNTILLNLQNKKYFKRRSDGKYQLAKK